MPRVPRARASAYEAGASGRRTRGWTVADPSANAAVASAPTMRARARDSVRNDSWATAIVETFVDDLIGWGIKPLSRATDEAFRQRVQAEWEDWTATADADGILDFAGLQAAAVRTMAVDGECFIRLRRRRPEDGLRVPLQIQVLPAEIVPAEYSLPATEGRTVREGIEFDAIGRRVGYYVREAVPGEDDPSHSSGRVHRVPAELILHLFQPLRVGQRRGVSMLAPALVRLHELDKFTDAVLLRQQISNMFAAFVTRQPSIDSEATDPLTGLPITAGASEAGALGLEPGIFQLLDPGEDVRFSDPPDAPAGFGTFVEMQLRAAGAACGVPFEAFSHAWGKTNDRLARVVLNQYRRRIHRLLWSIVVPQALRPIWNEWFTQAVLAGVLPARLAAAPDARRVSWAPHAHAYVHPVQDVASYREAIRAGLTSRAAAVAETGEDVEVIDAQNAADNARADRLGVRYDSDARQQKGGTR